MRRVRGMAAGKDGNLYMITGEFERSCKLHTWDMTGKDGFSELGLLASIAAFASRGKARTTATRAFPSTGA